MPKRTKLEHKSNINQSFAHYLQSVGENEKLFSKKEIARAKAARDMQEFLAWPSTKEFMEIVQGNFLRNCDVNTDDIKRALYLYGEPVPYLQGRMTRRKPLKDDPLARLQSPLPAELHEKRIELYIDIFHFKQCQFILMESDRIKYVEIKDVYNQRMDNLIRLVLNEIKKYTARGLQVSGVHVDNQFCNEAFENTIKPAILIPYAARASEIPILCPMYKILCFLHKIICAFGIKFYVMGIKFLCPHIFIYVTACSILCL